MFKCRNVEHVEKLSESLTKTDKVKSGVKVFVLQPSYAMSNTLQISGKLIQEAACKYDVLVFFPSL